MKTLADLLFRLRDHHSASPQLLSIKRHSRTERLSTGDFLSNVQALALALEARGLSHGQRVVLFSENRPEWHIADFACHLLGAVSVPIYPTSTADQVAYVLKNCGASWVMVSDARKAQMLRELRSGLSRAPELVMLDDPSDSEDSESDTASTDGIDSLTQLLGQGATQLATESLDNFRGRAEPEAVASIIYTSGTTGEPKGVMLTHANFVSNLLACSELFPLGPEDQALSFLPLSHVFERTVDYLFFYKGVKIHYSPSIERAPMLFPEVKPTVLTSVPRVYERAFLRIQQNVRKEAPRRQKIFAWAVDVGKRHASVSQDRYPSPWLSAQRKIADRLVFQKIRERFGGQLRFAISGGAPLDAGIAEFFGALGIRLYEGYGLTETAPVISANSPQGSRPGSVGSPVPDVEVKIASDGEILVRSPGVMKGYWENEEATRQVINDEGWFATGDVGHLDEDGFLFITDRKKDLLITSGGKNVAPQPIERMLTNQTLIGQAVVFGDRYPYLTALLAVRTEELPDHLVDKSLAELQDNEQLQSLIEEAVANVNKELADHERVRRFRLLDRELTQEDGEITPTLKVKRKVVAERYADLIASMYNKTQRLAGS